MSGQKLAGVVAIVAGVLALVYGGFSYTKETHEVKLGPIDFAMKEKSRVDLPVWSGVGAITLGVVLLLLGGKKG